MAKAAAARGGSDLAAFRRLVREKRGGAHFYVTLLGLDTFDALALLERVQAGLPYSALEHFQQNLALSLDELAALLQIKRRTLARRREEGRLSAEESDRLLRASRVFGAVLALFEGDLPAARAWFSAPAPALGSRTPREVAASELGAREVENLVGRLEHGVFS